MKKLIAKLDYQHVLLIITGLVSILGPSVVQVLGLFNLSAAATQATSVIGFITMILSLVKQFVPADPTNSAKIIAKIGTVLLLIGGLGGLATSQTSCTPAQSTALSVLEKKVLADIEAGGGLPVVEGDVEAYVASTGVIGADIVMITNGVLNTLVGLGYIPPGFLPATNQMIVVTSGQLVSRGVK